MDFLIKSIEEYFDRYQLKYMFLNYKIHALDIKLNSSACIQLLLYFSNAQIVKIEYLKNNLYHNKKSQYKKVYFILKSLKIQ